MLIHPERIDCAFCHTSNPQWRYNDWTVCAECRKIIDRDDHKGLVDRELNSAFWDEAVRRDGVEYVAGCIADLQEIFWTAPDLQCRPVSTCVCE